MLNSERDILYSGAICVSITQIIYLFLLQTYIDQLDNSFKTDDFLIMIPRFISSLIMHMVVMPDGRQGIRLMKFAYKHPDYFNEIDEE